MAYTWQRFFAMIRILRTADVLDNDISWEETCDEYYRGIRPICYNFKVMTDQSEKQLMDNLEDMFQEVFHMQMLYNIQQ